MNFGQFLRKEWGAVSFVVTVIAGLIIVPAAFVFLNKGPSPVTLPGAYAECVRQRFADRDAIAGRVTVGKPDGVSVSVADLA